MRIALKQGNIETTQWILFTLMKDIPGSAIKLLNSGIKEAAATGTFVQLLKGWINELIFLSQWEN